ncbi:CLUMA_CG015430, isoform A [Clunio marinus]|uniref:CLUMA_CG015430, isoform A n=1 Tax=Clunio marinus TaxID=568069 RepID=A0A1J1IPP1_9DIPT|nr:CLUMA_CG015430, isoform A [Clunio marinus]
MDKKENKQYTADEITKLINDSEILIVSSEETFAESSFNCDNHLQENFLTSFNVENQKYANETESSFENTDDDFKKIYESRLRGETLKISEPASFSHLFKNKIQQEDEKSDPERALLINRILKEKLISFKVKLQNILKKIDAQSQLNNAFLERSKSCDIKDSLLFKTSYAKCGAPFFKDALGTTAPFNEDYKFRKQYLKEFFPFDVPTVNSRWKTKHKIALINGVKSQMIRYIKSQQSTKLCQDAVKTRGKLKTMKFISKNQDLENSTMMQIYKLITSDFPNFMINWNLISFDDLQSSHSVSECMGMWFSYLRPDLNRDEFSEEENQILQTAVRESKYSGWNEISSLLNRRSSLQAFVHYHTIFARLCPSKVRWTAEEDDILMAAIERNSQAELINWGRVGQALPSRNRLQCYNRYKILTKSSKKKGPFTPKENRIIINYVEKYGEAKFNEFPAELLPGRSSISIKNHYNNAMKHKGIIHPWTKEEDKKLMEFVKELGTGNWTNIADALKTHNRLSCRTRFLTISKYLSSNPNATLEDVPSRPKKNNVFKKSTTVNVSDDSEDEKPSKSYLRTQSATLEAYKKANPVMYNMMMTTYDLDFGNRNLNIDNLITLVLKRMLNAENVSFTGFKKNMITNKQKSKLDELSKYELDPKLLSEMEFTTIHSQFLMPPNYSTVVGLRAIAIKQHEDPLTKDIPEVDNPSEKYRTALLNFQKLFFSLFYWTAMVNKVKKTELNKIYFLRLSQLEATPSQLMLQLNDESPIKSPRKKTDKKFLKKVKRAIEEESSTSRRIKKQKIQE